MKIKLELSLDRQQFANLFFGFIVKAKQPSPCELGCLLIVVSAVDLVIHAAHAARWHWRSFFLFGKLRYQCFGGQQQARD